MLNYLNSMKFTILLCMDVCTVSFIGMLYLIFFLRFDRMFRG